MIEEVRGTVIGPITWPYQFWTVENSGYPLYLEPYRFAEGHFENDAQAEEWVKKQYPERYVEGIEMRCYDVI